MNGRKKYIGELYSFYRKNRSIGKGGNGAVYEVELLSGNGLNFPVVAKFFEYEGPDKDKIDKFELAGNRNLLRIFASTNVWNSYVRFNVALGNEYLCNIGVKKEDITYHINDLIAYMRMDLSGGCK